MKAMSRRIGLVVALLVLVAAPTRAASVTYQFTAVDHSGRTAAGRFFYDTAMRPTYTGAANAEFERGLAPSFPMGLEVEIDGYLAVIPAPGFYAFYEIFVMDSRSDAFVITSDFRSPLSPSTGDLQLALWDDDGDAFDTFLSLPSTLDLDLFETRSFSIHLPFDASGPAISFGGTITSLSAVTGSAGGPGLAAVPEPSSLACSLLGAALAGGGWWLSRRRRDS